MCSQKTKLDDNNKYASCPLLLPPPYRHLLMHQSSPVLPWVLPKALWLGKQVARPSCRWSYPLAIGLIFLLLGLVLGPISICLAVQAKKEIEEHPNELDGACQAKAGLIIGIISTVLSVVWIVLIIAAAGSASMA
jgi:hypothetical protein